MAVRLERGAGEVRWLDGGGRRDGGGGGGG